MARVLVRGTRGHVQHAEDRLELRAPFARRIQLHAVAHAGEDIGGRLVRHADALAAAAGVPVVRVDCWAGAPSLVAWYERQGFVPNVVFPTGIVEQGENVLVYYGAADTCTAVVEFSLREMMEMMIPVQSPIHKP